MRKLKKYAGTHEFEHAVIFGVSALILGAMICFATVVVDFL